MIPPLTSGAPTMSHRRVVRRVLPVALLAALALVPALPAVAAVLYPRLGLYETVYPNGWPFIDSTGTIDLVAVGQIARYREIVLDPSPISDHRPDLMAAIRASNPGISVLAYVPAQDIWWLAEAPDSLVDYPTRCSHLLRDLGGYLYNRTGGVYDIGVNIAKRDSTGRFVVAEGLVDLWYDAIARTGLWDGFFLDIYCDRIDWSQSPAESIDVVRAGYPDWDSFAAAWVAAGDTIASRLRRLCGPDYVLVGNCAMSTRYPWFNGWMRENFPLQGGGTWYQNMLGVPGGYMSDESAFVPPVHNYLFTAMEGGDPYSAANARKVRFGLGSAALGTGFGVFGPSDKDPATAPFHRFWYDEYAVDLATGASSTSLAHTGWLGTARGGYYQMIWAGSGFDPVTNPDFESSVTDGWSLWSHASAAATLARDTTTSATGRASALIHVGAADSANWHVTFWSTGYLPMVAHGTYTATFWARASKPRVMSVAAAVTGTSYAAGTVELGPDWRQYQVILTPRVTCTAQLHFWLGLDDGDVWLDDVHLRQGVTGIYRRDFANGTVLVNPSGAALTVPLGTTFRKILGTVDPVTNDGTSVTGVTVPGSDAIFLVGADTVAPDAPRDLRIGH
jgi:hypothetical protein